MMKLMRRYGWIGILLLGAAIGAVSYRALRPTVNRLVLLYAPQGVRECKIAFSIDTQAAWGGFPVIADGGGMLACDQRSEVDPGLWVGCKCRDGDSTPP